MSTKNLKGTKYLADGGFGEIPFEVLEGYKYLKHLSVTSNAVIGLSNKAIYFVLASKTSASILTPADGAVLWYDILYSFITTSGAQIYHSRQEYDLKDIDVGNYKKLYFEITNSSGNAGTFLVNLIVGNQPKGDV